MKKKIICSLHNDYLPMLNWLGKINLSQVSSSQLLGASTIVDNDINQTPPTRQFKISHEGHCHVSDENLINKYIPNNNVLETIGRITHDGEKSPMGLNLFCRLPVRTIEEIDRP